MDTAYLSALSALLGSTIGAFASIITTWLTQRYQTSAQRRTGSQSRLEGLAVEFIEHASVLLADAVQQETLRDPSKIIPLYAALGKLRLFAPEDMVSSAETAMEAIIDLYYGPQLNFEKKLQNADGIDVLRPFERACRRHLRSY